MGLFVFSFLLWSNERDEWLRLGGEALLEDVDTLFLVLAHVHPEVVLVLHDLRKDRTSEEHHVLTSGRILNTELELVGSALVALKDLLQVELTDLLLETAGKTGVHAATTRKHDVLVELRAGVHISGLDGVEESVGNTRNLKADEGRIEEGLGSLETLSSDLNHTTIRKGVGLDEHGGLKSELLLEIKVVSDIAELLLDLTDGLEVSGSVEGITTEEEELDEVASDIATGDIKTLRQMRKSKALEDRNDVGDTIARVNNNTGQN